MAPEFFKGIAFYCYVLSMHVQATIRWEPSHSHACMFVDVFFGQEYDECACFVLSSVCA